MNYENILIIAVCLAYGFLFGLSCGYMLTIKLITKTLKSITEK